MFKTQPTLALDFTNGQQLDPRIKFVRPSSATRVNKLGVLETVGANVPRFDHEPADVLAVSAEYATGSWIAPVGYDPAVTTSGATVTSVGATTPNRCALVLQEMVPGAEYTLQITVNSKANGDPAFFIRDGATAGTGTTIYTGTMMELRKYTFSFAALTKNANLLIASASPTSSFSCTVSVVEVAKYLKRKGECKGLLIEEQRTNSLLWSTDITNAAWITDGVNVTAAGAGPMDLPAYKVIESATGPFLHRVFQTKSVTTNTYSFSIYAKAYGRTKFQLASDNGLAPGASFDLAAISATPIGTTSIATITPVGNGWFLCSAVRPVAAGTSQVSIRITSGDFSEFYTGDGVAGILIAAPQLEVGAFPTSYIPTNGATATRGSDSATIYEMSWVNDQEGSFVASVIVPVRAGRNPGAFDFYSNSSNRMGAILADTGLWTLRKTKDGINQTATSSVAYPSSSRFCVAASYSATRIGISVSGGTANRSPSSGVQTGKSTMFKIGAADGFLNGTVKGVVYFPVSLSAFEIKEISKAP